MRRGAKRAKAKVETKPPVARKSRKREGSRVHDLEKRLAEALEQQTATSEILRIISSSPIDLQLMMDTVAERAARLCEASDAQIFRLDGEAFHLAASHGPLPPARLVPVTRGSVAGRATIDRQIIHIRDIATEPISEFPDSLARGSGVRTVLAAPLLREGVPIGVIVIRRMEVRPFSDKQLALLQTFADQAVIAIENVRLFNETKEALEQQTATSEVLKVISRSAFDLQPVFDTMAESAVRLCGAERAFIFRFDGELLRAASSYNVGAEVREFVDQNPIGLGQHSISARAALERRTVHIPDVQADPAYAYAMRDVEPIRTILAVPMLKGDALVGTITIYRLDVKPFTDKQVALVETFADQAVIAIENVRLFTELEARNTDLTEALEQQTATSNVLKVISRSTFDLEAVLTTLIENATRLCGAHQGFIFRAHGERYHLAADYNASPTFREWAAATPIRPGDGRIVGQVAVEGRVVQIVDAQDDAAWRAGNAGAPGVSDVRALLGVPMLREGVLIGVFAMWRLEPRPFTDKQIELVTTFADQAVIAIENVRLFTELQEKNRALSDAHGELTEALEQTTATSEVLKVISRSTFDLQPVLDTLIENATRLCGATRGHIFRFDGELLHYAAAYGATLEFVDYLERNPVQPGLGSVAGRAASERRTVHVRDVFAEAGYEYLDLQRLQDYRTVLAVPMLRENVLLGVITILKTKVEPFTPTNVELVTTFADQAVIAIENVRLLQELQARTGELARSVEELKALGEVSRAVSSTLDLETVLNTIVGRAVQLSAAHGGLIYEYDEMKRAFNPRSSHHLDKELEEVLRATPIRLGEGVAGKAAALRAPVQVPDVLDEQAYDVARVRAVFRRRGYRSLLAVPLLFEQQIIGVLVVWRQEPGTFAESTVNLLQTFATQSALAIQNARLFHEIADKSRQLEVASQHKSEFLANMSHELRTPLNAIIGFSEVLAERMFGEVNAKQAEYLQDILESGRHLLSLINDILDLSKIEAGRMELEAADFDLPSAIDNALILVRERATRRGITLGRHLDAGLGSIHGDERKVKQVLLNLLSNALKFTPEGGRIDVRAALHEGWAEVSVADTGVGIAPEDQAAVFEEFRQVGPADKKGEGTGLGLALSQKFVQLHGGRLWVESQPGVGSTFTFTLPLRPDPA
jgi:GAF domain-containing protein